MIIVKLFGKMKKCLEYNRKVSQREHSSLYT